MDVMVVRNPSEGQESGATRGKAASFAMFREDAFQLDHDWEQESFERLQRKYGFSTTWVYVGVNRNAVAASQIPIILIKKSLEGQPNSIVRTHDRGLLDLLDRPNPFQSQMDFIEACVVSLDLTGNLFIEKVDRNNDGRPEEIYVLNPARITIIPDAKKLVKGYIYRVNGGAIPLLPEDVVHVKYAHPSNDHYGFSPITAARIAIETDRAAQDWNRTFLLKGGWPGGAIELESDPGKDEVRRLKREIREALSRGKDVAGRIILLTGGAKYNKLALGPKETDWVDARRMSRDEILAILGVPFAVAGIFSNENTTTRSAGVEQQIKQYYRGTVCSRVKRIADALNRDMVPAFGDNFKLVPDLRSVPALADDVQTEFVRAQAARTLISSGFSINSVAARFYPDMPQFDWGDVAWMNQAMVPIEGPENPFAEAAIAAKKKPKPPAKELPEDENGVGIRDPRLSEHAQRIIAAFGRR